MDLPTAARVLDAMEAKARELGVTGVAVYLNAPITGGNTLHPHARVVERMERPADTENRGPDDTGTNYFAVVFGKVGEMLSIMAHSGKAKRPSRTGENGWPGGLFFANEDGSEYFAFSGGTGPEDVMVAEAGASVRGYKLETEE